MECQSKLAYRPPVFVSGVMGGHQTMSCQPGFSGSKVLTTSPVQVGKLSTKRVPSPKRELASRLP